jgi:hypothetical protein
MEVDCVTHAHESVLTTLDTPAVVQALTPTALRDAATAVRQLARGVGRDPGELTVPELAALDSAAVRAALARARPRASAKSVANRASAIARLQALVGVVQLAGLEGYLDRLPPGERRPARHNVSAYELSVDADAALECLLDEVFEYKNSPFPARARKRRNSWRTASVSINNATRAVARAVGAELAHRGEPLPASPLEWLEVLASAELVEEAVQARLRLTAAAGEERLRASGGTEIVNSGLVTLARGVGALVAMGPEFILDRYPGLGERYAAATPDLQALQRRTERAHLVSPVPGLKPDVARIVPADLWRVGTQRVALIESGRFRTRQRRTAFNHARVGTMLALCAEFPLRIYNWTTLTWANLTLTDSGLWRLQLSGVDLKVAVREGGLARIDHTFSVGASELITRWRELVRIYRGADALSPQFTAFTSVERVGLNPTRVKSVSGQLGKDVRGLWISATGRDQLQFHVTRNIVATWLIAWGPANRADGIALAAHALSDEVETVIENYYRPDTSAFAQYAAEITTPQPPAAG